MRHYSDSNPHEPDDSGDDPVCYLAFGCVPAELEAQASVDDTERHHETTPPDVGDAPDCTLESLLVDLVVEKCESGLEVKAANDDDANDGMAIAFSGDLQCVSRASIPHRP